MTSLELHEASINKSNKGSPVCGNINKNLLTPCRQVGLSRKRKTPVSNSEKTPKNGSFTINITNAITSLPSNESTPVTHNNFVRKRGIATSSVLPVASLQNKLKESTAATCSPQDILDNRCNFVEENVIVTDCLKTPLKTSIVTKKLNEDPFAYVKYEDQKSLNRKLKKRRLSGDFLNFEGKCIQPEIFKDITANTNFENDFVSGKEEQQNSNKKKEKHLKKSPSISKSDSASDNSLEVVKLAERNCTQSCKIRLQRLSEEEISKSEKLIKRTDVSFVDVDFFTSTPEDEKLKRNNLEKNLRILENQIKQKQLVLENLQRASIYKNKHNVQDLMRLTSIWSNGCIQALKDLLTHLQAHGPIDITTVLKNMGLPEEILAKLNLTF